MQENVWSPLYYITKEEQSKYEPHLQRIDEVYDEKMMSPQS